MANQSLYKTGSEWRRWDLHIHTPNSICQKYGNTSDGWEKFINALESLPEDVKVIGITDYYFIDGYERVMDYKLNKDRLKNIEKIFPILEFRIDTFGSGNENNLQKINLHVLFDLDESKILDEVNLLKSEFINKIKISALDIHKTKSLSINNFISIGGNLEDGFESLVPSTKEVFDIIESVTWKHRTFLFLGYKEWSNLEKNQQLRPLKDYLYGKVGAFFGSNFQNNNKNQNWLNEFGGKKLLHSLDIHDFLNLDTYEFNEDGTKKAIRNYECNTWIKSDPTFEGLKQIIFEPEERVKIQRDNPYNDRNKIFFNSIRLTGSTKFIIPDFELPLNRELITLIGGRGTGKSAFLDTFAFLNEEHIKMDQNEKNKIIEFYRENENKSEPVPNFNLITSINDKDGNSIEFSKELLDRSNLELPFLYLGQEQLSRTATNDFELTRTVCQLIGIDVNKIGQEALISRARSVLSDIDNNKKLIDDIVARYTELGYSGKIRIERWIEEYVSKLTDQQKRLSSKETREILEDINKKTEQDLKLKDLAEKAEVLQLGLRKISANEDIDRFNLDLQKLYTDITPITLFDADRQIETLTILKERIRVDKDDLKTYILTQKQVLVKQGIKEDVNSLLQASENLQKQISSVEKDQKNYSEAQSRSKHLHLEREDILTEVRSSLETLRNEITSKFTNFEQSRIDSTSEERNLFEGIIKGISVVGQIEFKEKIFIKELLSEFIDNRNIQNETELKKIIAGQNPDGTAKDITMDNVFTWIQSDLSDVKFSKGGLDGVTDFIFTRWNDFLGVKAVAKLNGKATEVLSIGQRGTLLLKVYLATSTAKQVFVIDQPEDNLDNSFIMNELVPLIRKAKKSRQIIMSTHNANLVVNADAEQVIVAQLDQEKGYLSGSIENPEINKNIRDILEGGEDAFRKREQKYIAERA